MGWVWVNGAATLPQRGAAFKAALAVTALLWTDPVFAQDGTAEADPPATLFSCGFGADAGDGYLLLSGRELTSGGHDDLRFQRVLGDDQVLYSFPPGADDDAFRFAHSKGDEGYLVTVRFSDVGRDHELYSLVYPANEEDEAGSGEAGLAVFEAGVMVEHIPCGEAPYMFITYMRNAMACDIAELGEAACTEPPATRNAPLTAAWYSAQ